MAVSVSYVLVVSCPVLLMCGAARLGVLCLGSLGNVMLVMVWAVWIVLAVGFRSVFVRCSPVYMVRQLR